MAKLPISCSSSREKTLPMGLCGLLMTIMRVLSVIAALSSSMLICHEADDVVLVAPVVGGCIGTQTTFPPGISMLLMYLIIFVSARNDIVCSIGGY